jgi:hypothetical protein
MSLFYNAQNSWLYVNRNVNYMFYCLICLSSTLAIKLTMGGGLQKAIVVFTSDLIV